MKSDFMPLAVERPKATVTGGLLLFAPNSSRGMTVAASDEKSIGTAEPVVPMVIVFRSKPRKKAKTKRAAAAKTHQMRLHAELPHCFRSRILKRVPAIALPPNR